MTNGRSRVEGLANTIASPGGGGIVLLCFTPELTSCSGAARQFLNEVANTFAGRVAVSCVRPEGDSDFAHEFVVAGAITLALFVGGREVARSVGDGGETMMRVMIERYAG